MLDIAALESLAKFWEWVDYIGLFLVLVGVFGESIVEFTDLIQSAFWKATIGKVSALALIVGLGLELFSMPRVSATNGRIVGMLKTQAAEAQRAAGEARQKAAEAESHLAEVRERAAKAEERAAGAEKATEEERIARLTLEAQVAPRRLSVGQSEAIAASLKAFKGRNVTVVTYSLDVEAAVLARQIIPVLQHAGIVVEEKLANLLVTGSFALGIHISGHAAEQDSLNL